jgi:ABC-type lipoprotein export system ATPase subunit
MNHTIPPIIDIKDVTKSFTDGDTVTQVLKGISLTVSPGEFVAIMGRSGAGKSTLLYQLSLLDTPTSGSIKLLDRAVDELSVSEKTRFRLDSLGYVFQDYSLLRAEHALTSVNLAHRASNLPAELSGGEQQRVSIARAITHKPKILFADEPTANLDTASSRLVMDIFKKLNKEDGLTVVMVTHEEEFGNMADRIIRLSDGQVVK